MFKIVKRENKNEKEGSLPAHRSEKKAGWDRGSAEQLIF